MRNLRDFVWRGYKSLALALVILFASSAQIYAQGACTNGQLTVSTTCTQMSGSSANLNGSMLCPNNDIVTGVGRLGTNPNPLSLRCCPATYSSQPIVRSTCTDVPYAVNTDAACGPNRFMAGVKFGGGLQNPTAVTCCEYTAGGSPLNISGTSSFKVGSNTTIVSCDANQLVSGVGDTIVPDNDLDKVLCIGNVQCQVQPTNTPNPTSIPSAVCGDGILAPTEQCDDGNTSDRDTCLSNCTANPQCKTVNFDNGVLTGQGFSLVGLPGTPGVINQGTTTIFDNPTTGGPASAPNALCNQLTTLPRCQTPFTLNFDRRPYFVSFYFLSGTGAGNLNTNSGVRVYHNNGLSNFFVNNTATHFQKHSFQNENISALTFSLTSSAEMIDDLVYCAEPIGCGDDIIDTGEQCDDGNNSDGDGCNATCQLEVCSTPYDLLILIDTSNSIKEQGLGDEVRTAMNTLIDTFDFSRNRMNIAGHAWWGMYNIPTNNGYTTDKNLLKARVTSFTTVNYGLCFPGNSCFGQFDDAIRNFFTTTKRNFDNKAVPQYVVLFNDGDVYQVPSNIPNNQYNALPYSDRSVTGYGVLSTQISQWRSFLNEYPVFWIRFLDVYSMRHPNFIAPGNTVKDETYRRDIADGYLSNHPERLVDAFHDTFNHACEIVTPIVCGDGEVHEPEEECDDGNTTNGDGCSASCNLTTECNDGLDNDEDGRTDCDPQNPDLGCFPDGLGGGGACNPDDDSEQDAVNVCTGACVDDRHCESGNSCIGGVCMATQCTVEGVNCDPDRCLAICPSVRPSTETPVIGETVQFTCTPVQGTLRYLFLIKSPTATEFTRLEGENGSNISPPFTIGEYGDYSVQCSLCSGPTDDTCLAFEEM